MYIAGSGPPVIVVPGVQGRWEWARPGLDALAARCRVVSYTLCGDFGATVPHDPAQGFDNYLQQLDSVFDRTGPVATLCGVSFGGLIALRYAATRPTRVIALVLVSAPSPRWAPNTRQRRYISRPWVSAPLFVVGAPFRMWPEIHAAFDTTRARMAFALRQALRVAAAPMIPGLMASRVGEQQAHDFWPDCSTVRAPTLVITGEPHLDNVVPVDSTRQYLSLIPGSKYVMIGRTGHIGLITRPDLFARAVGDFVHQASSAPAE